MKKLLRRKKGGRHASHETKGTVAKKSNGIFALCLAVAAVVGIFSGVAFKTNTFAQWTQSASLSSQTINSGEFNLTVQTARNFKYGRWDGTVQSTPTSITSFLGVGLQPRTYITYEHQLGTVLKGKNIKATLDCSPSGGEPIWRQTTNIKDSSGSNVPAIKIVLVKNGTRSTTWPQAVKSGDTIVLESTLTYPSNGTSNAGLYTTNRNALSALSLPNYSCTLTQTR